MIRILALALSDKETKYRSLGDLCLQVKTQTMPHQSEKTRRLLLHRRYTEHLFRYCFRQRILENQVQFS